MQASEVKVRSTFFCNKMLLYCFESLAFCLYETSTKAPAQPESNVKILKKEATFRAKG